MSFTKLFRPIIRTFGIDVVRFPQKEAEPEDLPPDFRKAVSIARPLSLATNHRLASTVDAVRYVTANSIAGAIVECGVWRGGNMVAAALSLLALEDFSRELFLYDTYEGMSAPTTSDIDWQGILAADLLEMESKGTGVWLRVSLEDVRANLKATGYPLAQIHFVKGTVEETIPKVLPGEVAVLRLDTDWYESTRHELVHLFPLLKPGGVLIIDDYGHWQGARVAVDEYLQEQGIKPLLSRIDYTCRMMVK
jgi:O-methyltransferase